METYKELFEFCGSLRETAEARTGYCYLTLPEKIRDINAIAEEDRRAAQAIKDCERLIEQLTDYRRALAVRYGQLETMTYTDNLSLTRYPDYGGGVRYVIEIARTYEDGTRQKILKETRCGKERREALRRYEELRRARPGIEAVKDIEKRDWEKRE